MDLRQLRYFVAIVEEGSLSSAAKRLEVAQPSLSQHVVKLEDELGTPLLLRSPRGVVATAAGKLLAEHAREILDAVGSAREAVRRLGTEPRGLVTLGLPSAAANVLSVPLVETVRLEMPEVRLRVAEAMSGYIQEWLDAGEIDLGILYDTSAASHLQVRPLLVEALYLVTAPDAWPVAADPSGLVAEPVLLAEVARLPLVLPSPQHGLRQRLDRIAREQGVELEVQVEMDALPQIKALVARAGDYTILPHGAVSEEVRRGELAIVPIGPPPIRRPVYLVRNPARLLTRASLEVERLLVEVQGELIRRGAWRAERLEAERLETEQP